MICCVDQLQAHYRLREEWDRLQAGNGRVEFLRTQALLRAVLPTPPARVLDVGGADGVHAEWLLRDGYDVTIIDPLEDHVVRARERGIDAQVGDARALDAVDDSVDVVVEMPASRIATARRSGRARICWRSERCRDG